MQNLQCKNSIRLEYAVNWTHLLLFHSQENEIMKEIMDNGPVQGMDFSSWCVCVCVFAQYCEPEDKNSKKHMPNDC